MRNQIVSRGNHWIIVRGKGASASRPRFKLDYFHQYFEIVDGVMDGVLADALWLLFFYHVLLKIFGEKWWC